jgi:flavin reductase (DIM6/NTAB) family NADH-FMN oxidoreductase RutF
MDTFKTYTSYQLATSELQTLLQNTVMPRPIAFASTLDTQGNPNLSPFSFFNVFSSNPPILIFSPARKGTDGTLKDTFLNIKDTQEVVINMVSKNMVEQMSLSSVAYAKGINEFEKAGFTMLPSEKVKPYRVEESPVQFECKVKDVIEMGNEPGAGNLVICEVINIHVSENAFDNKGNIDPIRLDLVGRMGGPYYIQTTSEGLFQIPKPVATIAMGIDALPEHIRTSPHLTGAELARLAGMEQLPKSTGVKPTQDDFKKAKNLISKGKIVEAYGLLY